MTDKYRIKLSPCPNCRSARLRKEYSRVIEGQIYFGAILLSPVLQHVLLFARQRFERLNNMYKNRQLKGPAYDEFTLLKTNLKRYDSIKFLEGSLPDKKISMTLIEHLEKTSTATKHFKFRPAKKRMTFKPKKRRSFRPK